MRSWLAKDMWQRVYYRDSLLFWLCSLRYGEVYISSVTESMNYMPCFVYIFQFLSQSLSYCMCLILFLEKGSRCEVLNADFHVWKLQIWYITVDGWWWSEIMKFMFGPCFLLRFFKHSKQDNWHYIIVLAHFIAVKIVQVRDVHNSVVLLVLTWYMIHLAGQIPLSFSWRYNAIHLRTYIILRRKPIQFKNTGN